MKVNRRTTLRLLATAGVLTQTASSQDAAPQPTPSADLESARADLQSDSQRIAAITLPRATEPACQFRA